MKKNHHQEVNHEAFGRFLTEEINRQKRQGIINHATLRSLCGISNSYLCNIKGGSVTIS